MRLATKFINNLFNNIDDGVSNSIFDLFIINGQVWINTNSVQQYWIGDVDKDSYLIANLDSFLKGMDVLASN